MTHSTTELIRIAHEYFPLGLEQGNPQWEQTREAQRQKAARVPASAAYDTWRGLLSRLSIRFASERSPDIEVVNHSLFLQSPVAAWRSDRCFTGALCLPARSPKETHHQLDFVVSFVVPYYALRSSHFEDDPTPLRPPSQRGRLVFQGDTCYVSPPDPNAEEDPNEKARFRKVHSFELSADEDLFARGITEEIEATFPGHKPIWPEVGLTVVPEVEAGNKAFGEATIFTCLFSDDW